MCDKVLAVVCSNALNSFIGFVVASGVVPGFRVKIVSDSETRTKNVCARVRACACVRTAVSTDGLLLLGRMRNHMLHNLFTVQLVGSNAYYDRRRRLVFQPRAGVLQLFQEAKKTDVLDQRPADTISNRVKLGRYV